MDPEDPWNLFSDIGSSSQYAWWLHKIGWFRMISRLLQNGSKGRGAGNHTLDIHTFLRNWNSAVIRPRDVICMILLTNNVSANSKTTFVPEVEILSKSSLDLVSLWLCFFSSLWSYKGSNYQYQDTWYVMFDIFLWTRNWWSSDLCFFAHYQALPIWSPNRSSTCATNNMIIWLS